MRHDQNFAQGEEGLTRDKVAERVGIGSGENYRKAKKVWDASKNNDPIGKRLVNRLDADTVSIHGAYTEFRSAHENTLEVVIKLPNYYKSLIEDACMKHNMQKEELAEYYIKEGLREMYEEYNQ